MRSPGDVGTVVAGTGAIVGGGETALTRVVTFERAEVALMAGSAICFRADMIVLAILA
jgi:hypothetical protein